MDKIIDIISKLTLEEKCELCAQADGYFGRVERLGLRGIAPQDNPRGGEDYFRSGKAKEGDGKYHPVAFPSTAAMGMSWDKELANEAGRDYALECRANPEPVSWLFRPGVNLKRSPLCGRNFEYISEDPILAGEIAGAYIAGLQSEGVAATLKHYICNHQEFERMTTNVQVSERALHEVYLRAFEIAIQKGRPMAVMTSYNRVNGEWINSNQHIMYALRKELGYKGVVVSDFAAIHHTKIEAHRCGMDIELAPATCHSKELLQAVKEGKISESILDTELERVFSLCNRLYETKPAQVDMEEFHGKARVMAEKCMVLLENDDMLPLEKGRKKLLVLGELAVNPSYMGGGSGHMNGYRVDCPLDEIRKFSSDVEYAAGYRTKEGYPPTDEIDSEWIQEAVQKTAVASTVIIFVGSGYCEECEGFDRKDIFLPKSQRMLLDSVLKVNQNVVLVVSCAGAVDLSAYAGKVKAILYSSFAGEAFGSACAEILFGEAEPGGRLAETFPMCLEQTPAYLNFCREGEDQENVLYGEDIFVGYRWYDARKMPVLYPFGYGLSYTAFEITDIKIDRQTMTPQDTLTVCCRVKNTGSRAGSQVIQLYVTDQESTCRRPEKELKAFDKVWLEKGETCEVKLQLTQTDFRYFSNRQNRWLVEDGVFDILIGISSQAIVGKAQILMQGGDVPFLYDKMTPLIWFIRNPKFYRILSEFCSEETIDFFIPEKTEWCILCYPLPFYRFAEPLLGKKMFTMEEIQEIIYRMNES